MKKDTSYFYRTFCKTDKVVVALYILIGIMCFITWLYAIVEYIRGILK